MIDEVIDELELMGWSMRGGQVQGALFSSHLTTRDALLNAFQSAILKRWKERESVKEYEKNYLFDGEEA